MAKKVQHPATARLFQNAAARIMRLRKQHSLASDKMWAGTLGSQFTKAELTLLADYLSPHDHALLKAIRRATT